VAELGLQVDNRVLFLDSEGEVLREVSFFKGQFDSREARSIVEELRGRLAAVVHLLPNLEYDLQISVVEVFSSSGSTVHGLVSGGDPEWIPITGRTADLWSQNWNRERKE
jgi:hypothetical protein